ncbi:hypothetical protein PR048_027300 [Dryococelus australis]|uniref:Uncharacterized protein n=1 Tax=Dryococelus australis TaxID=614101 RepID=A0ABQ9GF31_9NEOP|nr:hypothetical protein PR048_027300 [Dryococelus australis]
MALFSILSTYASHTSMTSLHYQQEEHIQKNMSQSRMKNSLDIAKCRPCTTVSEEVIAFYEEMLRWPVRINTHGRQAAYRNAKRAFQEADKEKGGVWCRLARAAWDARANTPLSLSHRSADTTGAYHSVADIPTRHCARPKELNSPYLMGNPLSWRHFACPKAAPRSAYRNYRTHPRRELSHATYVPSKPMERGESRTTAIHYFASLALRHCVYSVNKLDRIWQARQPWLGVFLPCKVISGERNDLHTCPVHYRLFTNISSESSPRISELARCFSTSINNVVRSPVRLLRGRMEEKERELSYDSDGRRPGMTGFELQTRAADSGRIVFGGYLKFHWTTDPILSARIGYVIIVPTCSIIVADTNITVRTTSQARRELVVWQGTHGMKGGKGLSRQADKYKRPRTTTPARPRECGTMAMGRGRINPEVDCSERPAQTQQTARLDNASFLLAESAERNEGIR